MTSLGISSKLGDEKVTTASRRLNDADGASDAISSSSLSGASQTMDGSCSVARSRWYRLKENNPSKKVLAEPQADSTPSSSVSTATNAKQSEARLQSKGSLWKSSKIISKTLSSIEVIHSLKGKGGYPLGHPSPFELPVTLSAPLKQSAYHINVPEKVLHRSPDKSSIDDHPSGSSPKPSITLTSASSAAVSVGGHRSGNTKAATDWKSLRGKLALLKKKEQAPQTDDSRTAALSTKESHSHRKDSGSPRNSNSWLDAGSSSRKSSQDEGIVCKKEDLMLLLTDAFRGNERSSSDDNEVSPAVTSKTLSNERDATSLNSEGNVKGSAGDGNQSSSSCIKMKSALKRKTDPKSEQRATFRSHSVKLIDSDRLRDALPAASTRRETRNVSLKCSSSSDRKSGSSKHLSKQQLNQDNAIETWSTESEKKIALPNRVIDFSNEREQEEQEHLETSGARNENVAIDDVGSKSNIVVVGNVSKQRAKGASLHAGKDGVDRVGASLPQVAQREKQDDRDTTGIDSDDKQTETLNAMATVKWDDSNLVDAMMLGSAIQAFLQGINSTPSSTERTPETTPVPNLTEKKVSFKNS